jgi:E3 ubiquitin-protein ligase synoviolin
MGHFHFLPSQPHVTPLNYGEGFGNDPNIQSLQFEANKKLLQQQIEVYLRSSSVLIPPHSKWYLSY